MLTLDDCTMPEPTEIKKGKTISVKVLPASGGDCLLVEVGDLLILLDGGYVNTYNDYLEKELKNKTELGIDLLIVTHIDKDHISGINKLLSLNRKSQIIPIRNIWHNAYRHLQDLTLDVSRYVMLSGKSISDLPRLSYAAEEHSGEKNISAQQGSTLAAMILEGKYPWNAAFGGGAVSMDNQKVIRLNDQVCLLLLSPDNEKLLNLKKYWYKELYKKGYMLQAKDSKFYDDAFEFLVALEKPQKKITKKNASSGVNIETLASENFPEDTEEPNGSSVAFILQHDHFRGLFLGDAHPDIIVKNVIGHFPKETLPIQFDLIKVAHHGSVFNTSHALLKIIDSERYIFSTNGSGYGHPDIETLARIIIRPAPFKRTLFFNYPVDAALALDVQELKTKYNYEVVISDGQTPIEPYSR